MRKLSKRSIFAAMSLQDAMKMFGFVPQDLSTDEIKARYRHLAKLLHPDRGWSTKKMQDLNEGYRILIEKMEQLKKQVQPVIPRPVYPPTQQAPVEKNSLFSSLGSSCKDLADLLSTLASFIKDNKKSGYDNFYKYKEDIMSVVGEIRKDPVLTQKFFNITKMPIAEILHSLSKTSFYIEDSDNWNQNRKTIANFAINWRLVHFLLSKT